MDTPIEMAKNKLQEFFQKQNEPLPKYTTTRIGGTDNCPQWVSLVDCSLNDEIHTYYGNPSNSKKKAELDAAFQALSEITQIQFDDIELPPSVYVFVDGENQPNISAELNKRRITGENFHVINYISKSHSTKKKIEPLCHKKPFRLVEVLSSRKDAVDIYMIMEVSRLVIEKSCDHLIVVTNDHFGDTLVELLSSSEIYNTVKKFYLAKNIDDLLSIISDI